MSDIDSIGDPTDVSGSSVDEDEMRWRQDRLDAGWEEIMERVYSLTPEKFDEEVDKAVIEIKRNKRPCLCRNEMDPISYIPLAELENRVLARITGNNCVDVENMREWLKIRQSDPMTNEPLYRRKFVEELKKSGCYMESKPVDRARGRSITPRRARQSKRKRPVRGVSAKCPLNSNQRRRTPKNASKNTRTRTNGKRRRRKSSKKRRGRK